jgi:hypothetical protein
MPIVHPSPSIGTAPLCDCPACRITDELTRHRDQATPTWGEKRAAFNFALVIARRACPEYVPPARTEGDV